MLRQRYPCLSFYKYRRGPCRYYVANTNLVSSTHLGTSTVTSRNQGGVWHTSFGLGDGGGWWAFALGRSGVIGGLTGRVIDNRVRLRVSIVGFIA